MAESQGVNKRLLKAVQAGETLVFPPLIPVILILDKKSSWQTTGSHNEESSKVFKGKTLKIVIIIEKVGCFFRVCRKLILLYFPLRLRPLIKSYIRCEYWERRREQSNSTGAKPSHADVSSEIQTKRPKCHGTKKISKSPAWQQLPGLVDGI